MDTAVIIAVIVVVVILYFLLSGNALNNAFDKAVTTAEQSCRTAIASQSEADFTNAIAAITAAKTAQSASLNQYNASNPAPDSVHAISARLDAIHCGNHTAEKLAIDAIATATAANQAANKSRSPDDIQTALSTRSIAFNAIKNAGDSSAYVTTALTAAVKAFKALEYLNETTDNTFVDSVASANSSCSTALASQNESDFADAIQKIATAKSNKIASLSQYSDANVPSAVKDVATKLNSVNCGLHTLDKAAISAVASAVASCATANASKLPTDIQAAMSLRAAAQKALSDALAQYPTGSTQYVTTALSTSIDTFNKLVYNNLVNDQDFIDTVNAIDGDCTTALKSASVDAATISAVVTRIAAAKTKSTVVLAQYTGFSVPKEVADAVAKLNKSSCATYSIDKPLISAISTLISYYNTAMANKTPINLYYVGYYYYVAKAAMYTANAAYKAAGYTTTSAAYDGVMKSFTDIDWAGYLSTISDIFISAVDKNSSDCSSAKSSQSDADFSTASSSYNNLSYYQNAIYYMLYGSSYPSGFSYPAAVNNALTKYYGISCNKYSIEKNVINTISSATSACAGTDVTSARKSYAAAMSAVRALVNAYGTSTSYNLNTVATTVGAFNSMDCSIANPFTLNITATTFGYFYVYINNTFYKSFYPLTNPVKQLNVSLNIPGIVPGDTIQIYMQRVNAGDPMGFIGSWNNSSGGTVVSSSSTVKNDSSYGSVSVNEVSSFPAGSLDLSAIVSNYPSGAKWLSSATDGVNSGQYYFRYIITAA